MAKKSKKEINVPNLRFPGFDGECVIKSLGELISIQSGFAFKSEFFTDFGIKLVIPKNFTKYGYGNFDNSISKYSSEIPSANYICKPNDLLVLLTDLTPSCELLGKPLLIKDEDGEVWLNQRIIRIDPFHEIYKNWLLYFLQTSTYHKTIKETATGSTVKHSSNKIINAISIAVPPTEEQVKISSFLLLIDERIQTQSKIIKNLESLMIELSNQIFEQKVRFKDTDGRGFTFFTLRELGETYNGLTGKNKDHFGKGKQYIQYKQVFDSPQIDIEKCAFVEVSTNEDQNQVQYGDIFFTISSETPDEIGMSSVLLNEVNELYLNSFCFGFRPRSLTILDPLFAKFLFRSKIFRDQVVRLAQGSTRYNISKTQLIKVQIPLPIIGEQLQIGIFLSSLEKKIKIEKVILEKLLLQKTYLLHHLFI